MGTSTPNLSGGGGVVTGLRVVAFESQDCGRRMIPEWLCRRAGHFISGIMPYDVCFSSYRVNQQVSSVWVTQWPEKH